MADAPLDATDDAIARLYDLRVGVVGTPGGGRHERPHKPVLLLAALDLIAEGLATADVIPWSRALRERFDRYFNLVRARDDSATPQYPFHHLQSDGIWQPTELVDGRSIPLRREPKAGESDTGCIAAALAGGLERVVLTPTQRTRLREALVARYFPHARAELERLFRDGGPADRVAEPTPALDDEDTAPSSGRRQGFRRKILEIYDQQCTACGLRIRVPGVPDGTFVDAAHLVPFADSRNDHPTNGLALCKNHHWAMDRFLIAPSADGTWHASPRLIPHRSPGEKELAELAGRPVSPPIDEAFAPAPAALAWRCERLLG